jgi:protein-S-isoprenylcysteine O-methyltransferase Ste14
VTADLITVVGLAIVLWTRTTIGGNWSSRAVITERHELVEGGPYRYVRHAIYSGVIVMALGTGILLPLRATLVGAPCCVAAL